MLSFRLAMQKKIASNVILTIISETLKDPLKNLLEACGKVVVSISKVLSDS